MKNVKYLGLIMIMALMLTGCGDKENSSDGIDNGSNKKVEYYSEAETIYFNAETGKICNDYKEENSEYKNTSGCLKWYLYSDNGDKTVNLLLDHNISNSITWNTRENLINGPSDELLNTLKENTKNWVGVDNRKDKYTLNLGEINYTIDYTGYKARLISAEEIKLIVEDTSSNEKGDIYFDKSTCKFDRDSTPKCKYGWLFDRTQSDCKNYGCFNEGGSSYWTSTAYSNDSYKTAYRVYLGFLSPSSVDYTDVSIGIRPVITIDKSLVK